MKEFGLIDEGFADVEGSYKISHRPCRFNMSSDTLSSFSNSFGSLGSIRNYMSSQVNSDLNFFVYDIFSEFCFYIAIVCQGIVYNDQNICGKRSFVLGGDCPREL